MAGILPAAQLLSSMLENGGITRGHDHWREVQLTHSSSSYSRMLASKGGREAGEWLEKAYENWKLVSAAVVSTAEGILQLAERGVNFVQWGESALGETNDTFSRVRLSNAVHFVVPNIVFGAVRLEDNEAFEKFRPQGFYKLSAIVLSVGSRGMSLVSQVELVFAGGLSVGIATFDSYGRRQSAVADFSRGYFAAAAVGVPCDFAMVEHSPVVSNSDFGVLKFSEKDANADLLRDIPLLGDYLKTLATFQSLPM